MKRFAITALLLVIAMPAYAQQSTVVKWNPPNGSLKYTLSQNVPVDDVPDHVVRAWSVEGVIPANVMVNGLKLVAVHTGGLSDFIGGHGGMTSYTTFVAENGDKLFIRGNGIGEQIGGQRTAHWSGTITGGTGKFTGIKGASRETVNFDPNPGGQITNDQIELEYTMSK